MLSPQDRQDKLVRATDLDALSCKYSINRNLYLNPPDEFVKDLVESYQRYLQYCVGYTGLSSSRALKGLFQEKKMPIINRGSYLRTRAIDQVVNKFIGEFKDRCQIVSLGSGSDTRAFQIFKSHANVIYHEIDFPESAKVKKLAILQNPVIRELVGTNETLPLINNKEQFESYSSELHTEKYHLHGIDLRTLKKPDSQIKGFQSEVPTLVISECVLCYLSPDEYQRTMNYWTEIADQNYMGFLIYEPMSLNDQFGETMTHNLQSRGLNLQTFSKYPDLISRKKFLEESCHLKNLRLTDMSYIGGYKVSQDGREWIDHKEMGRINKLEMIDEIEEIRLLLEHYCLIYGEYTEEKTLNFKGIDTWSWILL